MVNNPADLSACYHAMGLEDAPFRITPDSRFFFPSGTHVAALTHLRFGMISGGFTVLTGEVGLGKTLLCRYLLRNPPSGVRTAYIYNPQQTIMDLMRSIFHDLTGAIPGEQSQAALQNRLLRLLAALHSRGFRVAVLVDEAHRLSLEVLEGLRLLSNLESDTQKLLSLMLVGQTELDSLLRRRDMRALRERIGVWHRLDAFGPAETRKYVHHRIDSVRRAPHLVVSAAALWMIHYYSGGVPRRINLICDRALLAAYALGQARIGGLLVRRAAREVLGHDR